MDKKANIIRSAVAACLFAAAGIFYVCLSKSGAGGSVWESGQVQDSGLEASANGALEDEADGGNLRESGEDYGAFSKTGEAAAGEGAKQDPAEEEAGIWIHVCGEVLKPGVYEVEAGSRVWQAVEAAGGFSEEADQDYLNMALTLEDGMKLVIPNRETVRRMEQAAEAGEGAKEASGAKREDLQAGIFPAENGRGGAGDGGVSSKVNINTASREALMTLKGIGGSRADDIIAYREANGPFQRIEDIMKVSGIKEASFEKIKEDITV